MSAPKNNQFWKQRSSHGRNPVFESKEDLQDAAEQYFQWVEDNPLFEEKAFSTKDGIQKEDLSKIRAMTIGGLCIFIGISHDTWLSYKKKQDFIGVTGQIEEIIKTQKFAGAAAGLLNANIIARDLGLTDKSESKVVLDAAGEFLDAIAPSTGLPSERDN